MSKPIVAYMRVSTAQQGRSGLGIKAQREAIGQFVRVQTLWIAAFSYPLP